ncbi:MAG: hypothetical protein UHK60_11185 [Acutalibacteraceae bacterium]|nr:hypothetical protein [Acutalibacteraceae bacterium]
MATINGSTNHSAWKFKLEAYETSYNVANNTSVVRVDVYIGRVSTISYCGGNFSGSINVDGQVKNYSGTIPYPTNVAGGAWLYTGATVDFYDVKHNNDGSKNASVSASWSAEFNPSSANASGSVGLTKIPRKATITNAIDFTDESNPKINYTNLAGNSVDSLQVKLAVEDYTINPIVDYIDIPKTGNEYEVVLTEEQRKTLRQYVMKPKAKTYYVLKTVIGGNNFLDNVTKEVSIINANPQFNDFDWETTNYNSLTGNNKTVIKNYSNIKTIVSEENKATALKEATLTSYQSTIGSKSVTNNNVTYPVENVIQKVDGASITVFANDSRGNSTPVIKPITNYIDYKKIIGSISNLERTQQVNSEVNLQVEGEIDLVNFGAIVNSVVSVKYYYKEASSNDDFVEGTTKLNATLTQIEGTKYKYEIDQNIAGDLGANGFDINKSFLIKIVINDELDFVEDTETLGNGSPAIAVYGNNVSLGAPYNESLGGRVQINGAVYDGLFDIYSTEELKIGKWINNKHLYRRVIELPNGTGTNEEKHYALDSLGINNVEEIYIGNPSFYTLDNQHYPFPYYDGNKFTIMVNPSTLKIQLQYEPISKARVVATLEYTKTTD